MSNNSPTFVMMTVSYYGDDSFEKVGRMYLTEDGKKVFADEGGWCTQYVTKHRVLTQREIQEWRRYQFRVGTGG